MKVIVAGSRTIDSYDDVATAISESGFDIDEIVSGSANGVDKAGEAFAFKYWKRIKRFPADWKAHGKAAGPIRNRQMAEYADAAVVVWDGQSRGSKNMIAEMQRLGKPVYEHIVTPKTG